VTSQAKKEKGEKGNPAAFYRSTFLVIARGGEKGGRGSWRTEEEGKKGSQAALVRNAQKEEG